MDPEALVAIICRKECLKTKPMPPTILLLATVLMLALRFLVPCRGILPVMHLVRQVSASLQIRQFDALRGTFLLRIRARQHSALD